MGLAGQGCRAARSGQRGYAMAALLVGLSVMSVMMAAALPVWSHATRREREEELIWRGEQYKRAIMLFQRKFANTFPPTVDILVEQKFLRKKYKDPITGEDFQIIPVGGAGPSQGGAGGTTAGGRPCRRAGRRRAADDAGCRWVRRAGQQQRGVGQQQGGLRSAARRIRPAAGGVSGQQPGGIRPATGCFRAASRAALGQQPGGFGQQAGAGWRGRRRHSRHAAGDGHSGRDLEEQGDVDPAIQRDGQVQPVGVRLSRRVGTGRIRRPAVRQSPVRRINPRGAGGFGAPGARTSPAVASASRGACGRPGAASDNRAAGSASPSRPARSQNSAGTRRPWHTGSQPAAPSPFRPPGAVPFGQPSPPR